MFPLLVKKELDNWPEMNTRKRRWVSVEPIFQLSNSLSQEQYLNNLTLILLVF